MAVVSAATLRYWNKITEIIIIVTNEWKLPEISSLLSPIQIIVHKGIFHNHPFDKCIIGELVDYSRIIYLDADTFIFNDIDKIFEMKDKDFYARLAWVYEKEESWYQNYENLWLNCLSINNNDYVPIFNSGLMLFNHFSHCKIKEPWIKNINKFIESTLPRVYGSDRHFDPPGLALAVSEVKLNFEILNRSTHGYGWPLSSLGYCFHGETMAISKI